MSASAKDILLKPISGAEANAVVKKHHYSGRVVNNSQIHIGVFYRGSLEGAMQFGPSLDKRKLQGLVEGTGWNEFIELNRMAFSDVLPRNSESRAIAVAMRVLRKHAPHLKWVVSFADATQCGDGTIYRASGFVLTGIKKNNQIWIGPSGDTFSRTSLADNHSPKEKERARRTISRTTMEKGGHNKATGAASMKAYADAGFRPLPGYQFRYVYFLDSSARERLTAPVIPFDRIPDQCRMYLGKPSRQKQSNDAPDDQSGEGGVAPTLTLHHMVKP